MESSLVELTSKLSVKAFSLAKKGRKEYLSQKGDYILENEKKKPHQDGVLGNSSSLCLA